jgi:Fe-S-cluster containining protein
MENQEEIVCRRCGKCCLANLIAYVTDEDWERWRREGRDDILRIIAHEHAVWAGDHLISSDDGRYLHGCPFLQWDDDHYTCTIYETRPAVCRHYAPGSSEICTQFR